MGKFIWFCIGGFIGYMAGFPSGIYFAVQAHEGRIVEFVANVKYLIEQVF
jgi:hypothetical protein